MTPVTSRLRCVRVFVTAVRSPLSCFLLDGSKGGDGCSANSNLTLSRSMAVKVAMGATLILI